MIYDVDYRNVEEVKKLTEDCPVMIDFGGLSEDVRDLLFDIHEYVDVMVGYADWYMQRKEPTRIYEGAFLERTFWRRFEDVQDRTSGSEDLVALKRIKDVAQYWTRLTDLMFRR